jgi:2-iminobutanoate/2-iminopropanoate deaminase
MTRQAIKPEGMSGVGPYSLAIKAGGFVHFSGQVPLDPATGKLVEGDIKVQTRQVLENLSRVMAADGLGFGDVVKCVVFLTDMANFAAVNEVYAEHMVEPYPARSCIQVAGLPLGAPVEIEAVAVAKS